MIIYIIFLTLILGIIIWGGITRWRFVSKNWEFFGTKKSPITLSALPAIPLIKTGNASYLHTLLIKLNRVEN